MLGWSVSAYAYRPFDGTDAAVANPGEVEIELQPAGRLQEGAQKTLVAPAVTLNYGFIDGWEVVLQGQWQTPLSPSGPGSLANAGVFLKGVIVPGSLQDKPGPSVATEFGLLLPDSTGDSRLGASVAGIVSQRWEGGTIHLNAATALTRDQHADLFLGIDSCFLHAADLFRIAGIGLFGPTDPFRFGFRLSPRVLTFWGKGCMEAIRPAAVLDALLEIAEGVRLHADPHALKSVAPAIE